MKTPRIDDIARFLQDAPGTARDVADHLRRQPEDRARDHLHATVHRGKHLASCLFEGGRWFCAADCQFHTIVDMDAEPRKKAVSR